jgi:hypothetical protein
VSLNIAHGEVYSIQHYVIKFVSGRWFSLGYYSDRHNITEILLKVALNTIPLTLQIIALRLSQSNHIIGICISTKMTNSEEIHQLLQSLFHFVKENDDRCKGMKISHTDLS